jgi:hypothetical protein
MRRNSRFDDEFAQTQQSFFRRFILGGLVAILFNIFFGVLTILFFCAIIYFFLAAAGIVPPADVIPYVPYV